MSDAPTWVPYAALGMSGASLVLAGLAFRAGGPRLRLKAAPVASDAAGNPFPNGSAALLTVVNAGRAAVTVQSFWVTPYGERKPVLVVADVSGEPLPFRLEAHAAQSWYVDALPAARAYDAKLAGGLRPNSSWPSKFRFSLAAGNGKHTHQGGTFDALRIIADARP